jgi:hypothetical protein
MRLIDRLELRNRLHRLNAALNHSLDMIIVGGAAVVGLVDDAEATSDIDLIRTIDLDDLGNSLEGQEVLDLARDLGISTASDAFEIHLPESWLERRQELVELGGNHLRVFVPCPEDLAAMKLFRFHAKDAADIEKLSSLPDFDPFLFRSSFLASLAAAIGHSRLHAQSFVMVWNVLMPEQAMDIDQVLAAAGIDCRVQ